MVSWPKRSTVSQANHINHLKKITQISTWRPFQTQKIKKSKNHKTKEGFGWSTAHIFHTPYNHITTFIFTSIRIQRRTKQGQKGASTTVYDGHMERQRANFISRMMNFVIISLHLGPKVRVLEVFATEKNYV